MRPVIVIYSVLWAFKKSKNPNSRLHVRNSFLDDQHEMLYGSIFRNNIFKNLTFPASNINYVIINKYMQVYMPILFLYNIHVVFLK